MKKMNKRQKTIFTFIPICFICGLLILLLRQNVADYESLKRMLLFVGYGMLGLAGFFAIYLQAMDAKKKEASKDKSAKNSLKKQEDERYSLE